MINTYRHSSHKTSLTIVSIFFSSSLIEKRKSRRGKAKEKERHSFFLQFQVSFCEDE